MENGCFWPLHRHFTTIPCTTWLERAGGDATQCVEVKLYKLELAKSIHKTQACPLPLQWPVHIVDIEKPKATIHYPGIVCRREQPIFAGNLRLSTLYECNIVVEFPVEAKAVHSHRRPSADDLLVADPTLLEVWLDK